MAMAAWKHNHAAITITLLALLAPMACHAHGARHKKSPILCSGGWARPIRRVPFVGPFICPRGSRETPMPPSPSPSPPPIPSPKDDEGPSGAGLYLDYYNSSYSDYSCPNAEAIVRKVVEDEMAKQGGRGIGAGLIRLHFHDCFVDGCDASVLLNTTASGNNDTEREGPPNQNSLRGFEVIDLIKDELEKEAGAGGCPNTVSCADTLAFAARDAARVLSGGKIEYGVPAGRWDGRESFANRTGTLPGPFSNLDTLKAKFADQKLNATDLVLLSGAHSIGRARCAFVDGQDMNQTLAEDLDRQCGSNSSTTVSQDYKTPDVLDSQYYQNVVDNDALFDSDAALTESTDTNTLVQTYRANSGNKWEEGFGEAMVKMGKIKTKTKADKDKGVDVEIRKKCWTYNAPQNY